MNFNIRPFFWNWILVFSVKTNNLSIETANIQEPNEENMHENCGSDNQCLQGIHI